MSHNRYVVFVPRTPEKPNPYFTFSTDVRLEPGQLQLFTAGSEALEAKWTLSRRINDQWVVEQEFVCSMPDSYQNYTVPSVENLEIKFGDRLDFSVNDALCRCTFVLDGWALDIPRCILDKDPNTEPDLCSTSIETIYSQSITTIGTLSL